MTANEAFGQGKYQVRYDVGTAGAARVLGGAHLVVVVDALSFSTSVLAAAEHGVPVVPWDADRRSAAGAAEELGGILAVERGGDGPSLSPGSWSAARPGVPVVLPSRNGGALAASLAEAVDPDGRPLVVLAGSFRNRSAVARRILELQEERGTRLYVAVVAAGEVDADGAARPAIEDELAAGAVIDALVGLGIDHTSPEAAVACAAFEGLKHAVKHLVGAGGSGVELTAAGHRADVVHALAVDASELVPELREGAFA